jgi:hypothetical protein
VRSDTEAKNRSLDPKLCGKRTAQADGTDPWTHAASSPAVLCRGSDLPLLPAMLRASAGRFGSATPTSIPRGRRRASPCSRSWRRSCRRRRRRGRSGTPCRRAPPAPWHRRTTASWAAVRALPDVRTAGRRGNGQEGTTASWPREQTRRLTCGETASDGAGRATAAGHPAPQLAGVAAHAAAVSHDVRELSRPRKCYEILRDFGVVTLTKKTSPSHARDLLGSILQPSGSAPIFRSATIWFNT